MLRVHVTSDGDYFASDMPLQSQSYGETFHELVVAPLEQGHRYELVVSYDPMSGWLSVAVSDVTTGVRIGSFEQQMSGHDGAIYIGVGLEDSFEVTLEAVSVHERYVAAGRTWELVEDNDGKWKSIIGRRIDRDRDIAIIMSGPQLGDAVTYQLTLYAESESARTWIFPGADVADGSYDGDGGMRTDRLIMPDGAILADGTLAIPSGDLPAGRFRADLEYTDGNGDIWRLGSRDVDVIVGYVDAHLSPFRLEDDTVTGTITLTADRDLDDMPFRVQIIVGSDDEETVWTEDWLVSLSTDPVRLSYAFPNPGTAEYIPIQLEAAFEWPVVSRVDGNEEREVMTVAWQQRMDGVVPRSHPRLYATESNIDSFRAYTDDPWWQTILKPQADALLSQPLPVEPLPGPALGVNTAEGAARWRAAYSGAGQAGSAAQTLAFAYLVTGDKTYADQAKEIALSVATWDARGGSTSLANDEAFIRIIHFLPFVYTWLYDTLSDDERVILERAITERGRMLYNHVTQRLSLSEVIIASHPIRFVPTLGLAGLALYHELDEAKQWVAWANAYYDAVFPPFGGDAGGWSEGLGYWNSGLLSHIEYLDALNELGVSDLYDMPFFRNTGYFGRYMLTPHRTSSFGGLSSGKIALSSSAIWLMNPLAHVHDDPYLYIEPWRDVSPITTYYAYTVYPTHIHAILHKGSDLTPGSPTDLPAARVFEDIGWVAMHSRLGHDTDNIMLTFKSSPYGSASHSHADQNSFILDAFGEPLFISAGYREWHGSSHHVNWNQQTVSKNAILMGGMGQENQSEDHGGEITEFFSGERFSLTSGQAAAAYRSGVNSWLRTILFVDNGYFLIHDYVHTNRARSYNWLLHSDHPMQLDDAINRITVEAGKAGAFAQIVHPGPHDLQLSQTNESIPSVDPEYEARFPKQWHVRADTMVPKAEQDFVTVIYPYRLEEHQSPDIETRSVENGTVLAVRLDHRTDLALVGWGDEGDVQTLRADGLEMTGRIAVVVGRDERSSHAERWFLQGLQLISHDRELWKADAFGYVEGDQSGGGLLVQADMAAEGEVRLYVGFSPDAITINGKHVDAGDWRYAEGMLHVRLPKGVSVLQVN